MKLLFCRVECWPLIFLERCVLVSRQIIDQRIIPVVVGVHIGLRLCVLHNVVLLPGFRGKHSKCNTTEGNALSHVASSALLLLSHSSSVPFWTLHLIIFHHILFFFCPQIFMYICRVVTNLSKMIILKRQCNIIEVIKLILTIHNF